MLQAIRNIVTGWVAVIIFVLLIIPFAFWGIDSYFGTSTISAAKVNGIDVSMAEYQRTFQTVRQQWQNISPDMAEQPEFIKQQTLDTLVNRLLLVELKDELELRVNSDQVRVSINEIPAFHNPEGFDNVAYQNFLLTQGYTPVRFETQVREDMSLEQIQSGLLETVISPKADALRLAALQLQTRDYRYALIAHDKLKEGVSNSEAEIQDFYQKNLQDFMSTEDVTLAYLHLSADTIAQGLTVDEASLKAFFDATQQNYSVAERRKVKQILVYTEKDNKDKAVEVAKEIHGLVTAGTSFDEIKTKYSHNADVTVEVSDFGFINKGVLDKAIDDAVFALSKGGISEPVTTEFGQQILLVEDITGGTSATFEQARAEVELDYRKEQAQKRFVELYDELAVQTYENPETLEVASESLGLPIQQSGILTRDSASEPLLNDPRVLTAAFSDEVLLNKNNSSLIEIAENDVVVVRLTEHHPKSQKALTDVHDNVNDRLLAEKATAKAKVNGEEIKQKLVQGSTAEALATEYSLTWNQQFGAKRESTDLDREILQKAFKAAKPVGSATVEGSAMVNGDYVVILLDAVHDVPADALTEESVLPVKNYLRQSISNRTFGLLMDDLRKRAKIEIFDANL